MREQLIDAFVLLPEDIVQTFVHLIAVLLDEPLDRLLVQPLIQRRVLSVHVDLAVGELEALHWLLVEHDVERDFLAWLREREERMGLHLFLVYLSCME